MNRPLVFVSLMLLSGCIRGTSSNVFVPAADIRQLKLLESDMQSAQENAAKEQARYKESADEHNAIVEKWCEKGGVKKDKITTDCKIDKDTGQVNNEPPAPAPAGKK